MTSQLIEENKIPEFGSSVRRPQIHRLYPPHQTTSTSISMESFINVRFSLNLNLSLKLLTSIHSGSHSDDEDVHSRLSEEQIFRSILSYVDHLFEKIKPKKLFFIAVDGVAPRAKMNQQRNRRFRSAEDARKFRKEFEKRGGKLPEVKAFDKNCITPGICAAIALLVVESDLNRYRFHG